MKRFQCSTCDARFSTEKGTLHHIKDKHTKSGKGGAVVYLQRGETFSNLEFDEIHGLRPGQKMSFADALDVADDDLPDGAFFAMAHEIAGLEYGEGFAELSEDDAK